MSPRFSRTVPILRMFDIAKAREFYEGFLGFEVDWEHRYGDDFPLYMQVSREGLTLHLSEHHGDACPGGAVFITLSDIAGLHAELQARDYRYAKPGLDDAPWGGRMVRVTDPFGNRLTFLEPD